MEDFISSSDASSPVKWSESEGSLHHLRLGGLSAADLFLISRYVAKFSIVITIRKGLCENNIAFVLYFKVDGGPIHNLFKIKRISVTSGNLELGHLEVLAYSHS